MRLALLNELDLILPENAEEVEEDPYLLLGYGINAYFDILSYLMKVFFVISVFVIPFMYIYGHNKFNFYEDKSFLSKYSLGNLVVLVPYVKR